MVLLLSTLTQLSILILILLLILLLLLDLNEGITFTEVAVEFINPITYDILIITKRLDLNKSSKTIGTFLEAINDYDTLNHIRGIEIDEILESKFGINHENFNRIVLTQNTTQMVNYTQLDLLNYMEQCCCSDKIVNEINILQISLKTNNDEKLLLQSEFERILHQYNDLIPNATKILLIKKQLRFNESELLKLLKKRMKLLDIEEVKINEKKDTMNDTIELNKSLILSMESNIIIDNKALDNFIRKDRIIINKFKKIIVLHEEIINEINTILNSIKRRTKEIDRDSNQRNATIDKISSSKKLIKTKSQQIMMIENQLTIKTNEKKELDESITLILNKVRIIGININNNNIINKLRLLIGQLNCIDIEANNAISKTKDAINHKEALYIKQMDLYKYKKDNDEIIRKLNEDITNISTTLQLQKTQLSLIKNKIDNAMIDKSNKSRLYNEIKQQVNKKQASNITNDFLRKCASFIRAVKNDMIENDKRGVYGML